MPDGQSLWERIHGWFAASAKHCVYARIPPQRTDEMESESPLEPYGSYFRLWLSEMFLTDRVAWGREWFPAVHSEVHLQFGGQSAAFSRVAQPPPDRLSEGVRLNYRLTELLPFNGGVVEIEAALLALKGADYLGTAIGVLQQFSSLVTPPLGQTISLAQKLATGTRDLLSATEGSVHLGLHQELTSDGGGGAVLRPGYHAVILARPEQLATEGLLVRDGRLLYSPRADEPPRNLQGLDYMLLRIEGREQRDDWRLRDIQEPLNLAIQALSDSPPNEAKAAAYKTVALAAAWQSPDLVQKDRRRVVEAIKAELAEIEEQGLGAVGGGWRDLDEIFAARAMSREQADALGELTASQVFDHTEWDTRLRDEALAVRACTSGREARAHWFSNPPFPSERCATTPLAAQSWTSNSCTRIRPEPNASDSWSCSHA